MGEFRSLKCEQSSNVNTGRCFVSVVRCIAASRSVLCWLCPSWPFVFIRKLSSNVQCEDIFSSNTDPENRRKEVTFVVTFFVCPLINTFCMSFPIVLRVREL